MNCKMMLVGAGASLLLVAGCATSYDMRTKSMAVLGCEVASISTEVRNPGSNVLKTTTIVQKDATGNKLETLAKYSYGGDAIINNAFKGSVGMVAIAGGYVGGQAVRRPDQTNVNTSVSGTSAAGSGSEAASTAGASAGAAAGVINRNTNANLNSNFQVQGQGQLQAQGQLQGQGQAQSASGGFTPPGQQD